MSDVEQIEYDEFGLFHENAAELGLMLEGPPTVRRTGVTLPDGRVLSALLWGSGPPEAVLLHGGAQNAHTWDSVAIALGRPVLCIDLPGHGHSDRSRNGAGDLDANAEDVAAVMRRLAPAAKVQVGMSLGGLCSIAIASQHPDVIRDLVLVDITPGADPAKVRTGVEFIDGPESFSSFSAILEHTIRYHPNRTRSSLRRGILHNAVQRADGSWVWRYQRFHAAEASARLLDRADLWMALERLRVPVTLARGMGAGSMVSDDDVAELVRRQRNAHVVEFSESGHSVQGDQPGELAELVRRRLDI